MEKMNFVLHIKNVKNCENYENYPYAFRRVKYHKSQNYADVSQKYFSVECVGSLLIFLLCSCAFLEDKIQ